MRKCVCRCHVKMGTPQNGDPGSPYSRENGDPGPYIPGSMGTPEYPTICSYSRVYFSLSKHCSTDTVGGDTPLFCTSGSMCSFSNNSLRNRIVMLSWILQLALSCLSNIEAPAVCPANKLSEPQHEITPQTRSHSCSSLPFWIPWHEIFQPFKSERDKPGMVS